MCLNLKDINFTHETKLHFINVYIAACNQSGSIFFNYNSWKYNWDNFYFRLNSSKQMLKAVKERQFYNATMIHKFKLQQNGNDVLFWQEFCIIRLNGLYPLLENKVCAQITFPTLSKY